MSYNLHSIPSRRNLIYWGSKSMKKRLLAILLCVSMVASLLTVGAMADDESEQITPASGTCGDNLTWELDESGTLTISGTGRMADYDQYFSDENTPPWATETDEWGGHFNKDITKVILEEGVTYIGSWAFDGCGYIEEVIFPSTLKSIGDGAFYNKPGLTELNLPSGLESVGSYAFFATWGIEEIVLPDGLKHIGEAAFGGGMELTKIIVPESVTEVGLGAFGGLETAGPIGSGCELEFGWTTSIPDNAFGGSGADNSQYSNFTSITLPNTITSIGDEAFRASQDLKHIKIPDSVKSIGDSAFWWSGIESVELPDGLESLGSGAFYNCEYLQSIDLPDSLSRIEKYTFAYCPSLESVTIPESITYIGQNAFSDTEWDEGSKSIYFEGDAPVCTDSGETGSFPSDATLYYLDGTDGWIDSEYYDPDTGLWRGYRLSIKIGGIPPVVSTTPVITLDKSYIEEGETATLTWNPVDSAVEYVVNIRKVGSEDGIQTYKKTSECKCEFSGLTEGTYYISVYAKDEHGNGSDLSNIVALNVYTMTQEDVARAFVNKALSYAGMTHSEIQAQGLDLIDDNWCASFVGRVAEVCGLENVIPYSAGVWNIYNNIKNAAGTIIKDYSDVKIGDIAIVRTGGDAYGHVGIVCSVDSESGDFFLVHGNWHNSSSRNTNWRSSCVCAPGDCKFSDCVRGTYFHSNGRSSQGLSLTTVIRPDWSKAIANPDVKKVVTDWACPIDIVVSYNGEILSTIDDLYQASFGTLTENADGTFRVTLEYGHDYDYKIYGNGEGTAQLTLRYYNSEEQVYRPLQ